MASSTLSSERGVTGLALRCSSCGAPYPGNTQAEILTCSFCGTTQRVVDARQFLDYFTSQIAAFVRQAVPPGLDVSGSSSVDPVARLAAFNGGVRSRLTTESDQYRFSLFNLLSSPVTILPFSKFGSTPSSVSPAALSMFVAKVQSVNGLAVDDASREILSRATGLASAYQSVLVAQNLLSGTLPERFHLAAQGLQSASVSIQSVSKWAPLGSRLQGLSKEAEVADRLLSGTNLRPVRSELDVAQGKLTGALDQLSRVPELGYMVTAVEQEVAVVRILRAMLDIVEKSPMVAPHPLTYLERLGGLLDWLAQYAPGDWAAGFKSLKLREEVYARAAEVRVAQAGGGTVRVIALGSGVYVPFWVVELPYTFETGVLWAKRGKEVPEWLLVAATFPTDLSTLDASGASKPLTDVFALSRRGPQLNKLYDRVSGKEQKISESGGLGIILQNAANGSIAGQRAVPPLTTGNDAIKLVQSYVAAVRSSNPKAATQLRASSPRVRDLVYVPCVLPGPVIVPPFASLSPLSVGDVRSILGLSQ